MLFPYPENRPTLAVHASSLALSIALIVIVALPLLAVAAGIVA